MWKTKNLQCWQQKTSFFLTQEPDSIVARTEQTNYSEQEEIARNNSEINIIAKHTNNIKSPIKFWPISHKPEINKLLL